MSNSTAYSESQAIKLAQDNDLIVGMPISFEKYVTQMRAVNPNLTLLTYSNSTFLPPQVSGGTPEAEFAHNAAGGRIKSAGFGTYLMEPSNAAWRKQATGSCAARAQQADYDGCLVDMLTMGIFSKNYTSSMPINPATGAVYTETDWRQQLINLAEQYQSDNPSLVIAGNALTNSSRYFRNDVSSRPIAMALPAAQLEDFLRGSGDATTNFPSAAEWLDNVHVITDLEASGHTGLYSTKLWSSTTPAQVAQWQSYSMATFLMGANGHSFFAFTDERTVAGETGADLPYSMPKSLGNPTSAMSLVGSVYERSFTGGLSVVNPGLTTATVSLGGRYRDLEGDTVSSITLPAHSGDVLLGSPVTDPPPTTTPTPTPTDTPTASPTATPTDTPTASPTATPTDTPTASPTATPTATPTPTPTTTPVKAAPTSSITSPSNGSAVKPKSVTISGQGTGKVTRAFVAIQNQKTHKWLHSNGTYGGYARLRVRLAQTGSTATAWSFVTPLPKGSYGVSSIVQNAAGRTNAFPRPWRTFTVKAPAVHHASLFNMPTAWWHKLGWL
jgi:hypothetical protein